MYDPRTAAAARLAAAEVAARAEIKRCLVAVTDRCDTNDPATRAWKDAIARWHLALERVYRAAFSANVTALKQARHCAEATGEWVWSPAPADSIETAMRFLEADLECFRSGYVKERLIRHLVRQPLGEDALGRLRNVAFTALDHPARREFRAFCASRAASRTTRCSGGSRRRRKERMPTGRGMLPGCATRSFGEGPADKPASGRRRADSFSARRPVPQALRAYFCSRVRHFLL